MTSETGCTSSVGTGARICLECQQTTEGLLRTVLAVGAYWWLAENLSYGGGCGRALVTGFDHGGLGTKVGFSRNDLWR